MARKKKEEKEKKELTRNEKIGYTVAVILLTPAITIGVILYRSFLAQQLLKLAGKGEKAQEEILEKDYPTNPKKLPYDDGTKSHEPGMAPFTSYLDSNQKMNIKQQAAEGMARRAGLSPAAAKMASTMVGGKKKRKNQKGGNPIGIGGEVNGFMSKKTFAEPYSWKKSDMTFFQGLGEYFIAFNIGNRQFEQKYLQLVSDMFYRGPRVVPDGKKDFWGKIFWQLEDLAKFTIGLGFTDFIKYCVFFPYQIYLLISCSFSAGYNPVMWLVMLIFAICTIFGGWVWSGGFFPWTFFMILAVVSIITPSKGKWDLFYGMVDMYRYVWAVTMWLVIGIAVPSIWGWTTKNGDANWLPIICSWAFPPLVFLINYLGLGLMPYSIAGE